jgi:hypothetical protein
MGTGAVFAGNMVGCGVDHLPLSRAEGRSETRYTSYPLCACMACYVENVILYYVTLCTCQYCAFVLMC